MSVKKWMLFALSIVIVILGIYVVKTTTEYNELLDVNEQLIEELDKNEKALIATQDELVVTQDKLKTKNNKNIDLQNELDNANTIIESMKANEYVVSTTVTTMEVDMLAKTVWGEARGCNAFEQSAVIWCILNRVDAYNSTIAEVITAPGQFQGYSSDYPVNDEIKALVEDVVARWKIEKVCHGNVGRTLPSNYLYFRSDSTGIGNVFRMNYNSTDVWNWDCWNPYS